MLLQPMLQRLSAAGGLREILDVALHDVIALHGAERGDIQLLAADGALLIVAQHNLPEAFLLAFGRVSAGSGAVCERALASGDLVFVQDVADDPVFAPHLGLAHSVPFRSVLSLPLIPSASRCIGVLSVHSASRFAPTPLELDSIRGYGEKLAQAIVAAAGKRDLARLAESLSEQVLAESARAAAAARRG
jgi:GAF domain-containing protein